MGQQRKLTGERVSPAKFAHVVIRTGQLENMLAWYEDVLGTTTIFRNDQLAFITYDDEHHRIALVQLPWSTSEVAGISSIDHFAYTLPSFEALLNTYVYLKGKGILPVWPINHGVSISFYYRDPDGNNVELLADILENMDEAKAYMGHGDEYRNDPVGSEFDADALIEAYEAGTPLNQLIKRNTLPEPKCDPARTFGPDSHVKVYQLAGSYK